MKAKGGTLQITSQAVVDSACGRLFSVAMQATKKLLPHCDTVDPLERMVNLWPDVKHIPLSYSLSVGFNAVTWGTSQYSVQPARDARYLGVLGSRTARSMAPKRYANSLL